jgi:PleD family two-component response regulator
MGRNLKRPLGPLVEWKSIPLAVPGGRLPVVPIRVILAEDNYLVREGVRRLLETEPDLELVAVCEDYGSLLAAIAATAADVVLTDIRMPPTGTN